MLDEPTTGLDPVARQEVLGALMEVLADERRTVLFSSQNTLDVEQISDQITFIDRGRIVDSGDKERFLERWRRVRLDVPPGVVLPSSRERSPRSAAGGWPSSPRTQLRPGDERRVPRCGSHRPSVDTMTLEEIFVAEVQQRERRKPHERDELHRWFDDPPPGLQGLVLPALADRSPTSLAGSSRSVLVAERRRRARRTPDRFCLITVMIAVGFHLVMVTVVEERTRADVAVRHEPADLAARLHLAKVVANLLIFLIPWVTLTTSRDAAPRPRVHGRARSSRSL